MPICFRFYQISLFFGKLIFALKAYSNDKGLAIKQIHYALLRTQFLAGFQPIYNSIAGKKETCVQKLTGKMSFLDSPTFFSSKVFKYVCSHVIGRLVLKVWISRSNYHVIAPPHYILPGIDLQPFASMVTRYRPRFYDQVGHQTIYASMGNKHFFQ